jgi:hypothetical protein
MNADKVFVFNPRSWALIGGRNCFPASERGVLDCFNKLPVKFP